MWGRLGKQLFFRGLDNYYYTRAISYRYRTIMYYTLPDGPPWYLLRSASPPLVVWDESNTKLVSRTDGRVIRIITKTLLIVPTKNERDPPLFNGKLLIKFQNILRNTTQVIIRLTGNRMFTLCRMITGVVFLRMF
jgi:hypothetical protein